MILIYMIFSQKCHKSFDTKVRQIGENFVLNKLVKVYRSQTHEVRSYIFDSRTYDVSLKWQYLRSHQILEVSCSCQYFLKGQSCPHVWATIIAINHDPFPEQASSLINIDVELGQFNVQDANSREEDVTIDIPNRKLTNPILGHLDSAIKKSRETKRYSILSEYDEQEIWYDIGANDIHRSDNLKITFMTRYRGENTKSSKLKYFNYQDEKVQKLSDPKDRSTLMLLKRFNTFEGQTYWQRKQQKNKNAICEVPKDLYEKILIDLSKMNRLCMIIDDSPFALSYDHKEVYFSFDVKNINETWNILGSFVDGDTKIPLDQTKPITGSGLLIYKERLLRVNYQGLEDLAKYLHKNKVIQIKDTPESQAELSYFVGHSTGLEHVSETGGLEILKKNIKPKMTLELHVDTGPMGISLWGNLWAKYFDRKLLPLSEEVLNMKEEECFLVRDMSLEYSIVTELNSIVGLKLNTSEETFKLILTPSNFIEITRSLTQLGVEVLARDGKVVAPSSAETKIKAHSDWFELKSELVYKDKRLTLPHILQKVKDKSLFIQLGNGEIGILPEEWLNKQLHVAKLSQDKDGKVLIHKGMGLYLDNLFNEEELVRPKSFSTYIDKLKNFHKVRMPALPETFKGTLRSYQADGVKWLYFLEKMGLGGCLADDMGLGKTVQVLATLESRRVRFDNFSSLVVAPKSLLFNWKSEIEKFTPEMRVAIYHGDPKERKSILGNLDQFDIILTTYGTCRRDVDTLKETSFNTIVLDESQAIKNESSQAAKSVCLLNSDFKIAMSGTPVENHLGELFSLFKFLNPDVFSRKIIGTNFDNPDEKVTKNLLKGLSPLILRRTKKEVLPELPEKMETIVYCDMNERQDALYKEMMQYYQSNLVKKVQDQGVNKTKVHVLEALLRLRQAACHPKLVSPKYTLDDSAKVNYLIEQLKKIKESGHKALIFSQFTTLLKFVTTKVDELGHDYCYLDGKTSNREKEVQRFQEDKDCSFFFISIKAGGFGLNLTEASYCFILDPWWNPAVEAQAVDRAHRIGQKNKVMAYRLVTRGTVEEKVVELQNEKKELAQQLIYNDGSGLKDMSSEDFSFIFS